MKFFDIRTRMLLTALLPVTLLAVLLTAVFLVARVIDNAEAHSQRTRSLIRQVASTTEYGLFSGNLDNLQSTAGGVMRDPDVRSVVILDARGAVLVRVGRPRYTALAALSAMETERIALEGGIDLLTQPITSARVNLGDAFDVPVQNDTEAARLLGQVVMEVSREPLLRRDRDMLAVGLAVSLAGLAFGGILAVRLGRGVVQPILRVSSMIERIARGDLVTRDAVPPNDPLRELQANLNHMATQLSLTREDLERRIASATQELRLKKEEAETATLAKSRFLAAASHDLRQPTHALGMFVARLAQLPGDGETRHLVNNLDAAVRAMQDLLDGLLDISRLDAGAVPVHVRAAPLAPVLDALRTGFAEQAREKGLRLRIRHSPLWAMTDPVLLHRILLNLVGNALRYTTRGSVLVSCRRTGDGQRIRIEVWDSGIGIASDHHALIFREFYQVGNTERDRTKGLGLGLNIVDRTARLLGHPLYFRSSLGQGTRFTVEVPLAAEDRQVVPPVVSDAAALTTLDGVRILVIEDDAMVMDGLQGLLTSWGCVVLAAEDRATALAFLVPGRASGAAELPIPSPARVDVIISDYRLRGGDNGIEVIAALRLAEGRDVPACLLSGDTDELLIQLARQADLTLLYKPVRPAKLRSLIRHLARSSKRD